MRPVVLIPAYQPGPGLVPLVLSLLQAPDQFVIVVDDGSSSGCSPVFDALGRLPGVHVLHHAVNLGKGQALKTGFNYFLLTFADGCPGLVTADADGQHLVADITRVCDALERDPDALHLGTRGFEHDVPWKSALGNRVSRTVFAGLVGRGVDDTQTGLRGLPSGFLRRLLRVPATGYEFELEMLVAAVRLRMPIRQVPIATVYEHDNHSTHFDPIRDSLRIYFVFLRFAALSMSTAVLDFAAFAVAFSQFQDVLASTIAARVVAGAYNFTVARRYVFKSRTAALPELLKFAALVLWNVCLSYAVVITLLRFSGWGVYVAKVVAETGLFVGNFAVQQLFVFRRTSDESHHAADRLGRVLPASGAGGQPHPAVHTAASAGAHGTLRATTDVHDL